MMSVPPRFPPCDDDPAERGEHLEIANHGRLRIRPLRRSEDDAIREFYARLTPQTRYLRFFSPMPALPESVLRALSDVDSTGRFALVAEDDSANGAFVGLASFGAIDNERAEVALVVRDDWQRRHLGTELAERVLQAAECRGYHRFVAHVSMDNVGIRRLLRHVGELVASRVEGGGVSELEFVRRRH